MAVASITVRGLGNGSEDFTYGDFRSSVIRDHAFAEHIAVDHLLYGNVYVDVNDYGDETYECFDVEALADELVELGIEWGDDDDD